MNLKIMFGRAAALALLSLLSINANGAQFVASSDICTLADCSSAGGSYTGASSGTTVIFSVTHPATDLRGAVSDGGGDAFDYFGYVANVGTLSLNRQTELLSGNIYRFFDTYTNNTQSTINTTVTFVGDLGSDGGTIYSNVNSFRQTSSDGAPPGDPVVGFIWGNNSFASAMVRSTGQGGNSGANERTAIAASLNLAVGQTVSLLYYAFLAKDLTDRSGDLTLALNTVNGLFSNPNFSGLSSQQQAQTLNWGEARVSGVPEPSTAFLTLGGLAALAWMRRRRA